MSKITKPKAMNHFTPSELKEPSVVEIKDILGEDYLVKKKFNQLKIWGSIINASSRQERLNWYQFVYNQKKFYLETMRNKQFKKPKDFSWLFMFECREFFIKNVPILIELTKIYDKSRLEAYNEIITMLSYSDGLVDDYGIPLCLMWIDYERYKRDYLSASEEMKKLIDDTLRNNHIQMNQMNIEQQYLGKDWTPITESELDDRMKLLYATPDLMHETGLTMGKFIRNVLSYFSSINKFALPIKEKKVTKKKGRSKHTQELHKEIRAKYDELQNEGFAHKKIREKLSKQFKKAESTIKTIYYDYKSYSK